MSAAEIRALFEARQAQVAKPEPLAVPGFGSIFVKVVDAKTAADNAEVLSKPENKPHFLALSAGMAVCDEAGALVFDISKPEDMALLQGLDPKTLSAIFAKSQLENGQGDEGMAAAGNG